MMNLKFLIYRLIILLTISFVAFSCDSEEEPLEIGPGNDEFLIFGQYAGFCIGESCVEIFKIENGKLFEDTKDLYPPSQEASYPGEYTLLSTDKYELVKDLIDKFPAKLKEDVNLTIGMPDAYDQGGVYIEIKENSKSYYWIIDRDINNIPDYLHEWIELVIERIELLNSN